MIVAVTGSSGLLGSALIASLIADGHGVIRLIRRDPRSAERALRWDPATGAITPSGPALADAVVHLAGESVAGGRWTAAHKQRIRDSRVGATRRLVETLTRMATPPAGLRTIPIRSVTTRTPRAIATAVAASHSRETSARYPRPGPLSSVRISSPRWP